MPVERWDIERYYDADPDAPGKMSTRWGGFLAGTDIAAFDAAFFGISPREARTMDPQQRLLLEMVYLGLEDAGISLDRVEDSKTGVFVGISTNDYSRVLSAFGNRFDRQLRRHRKRGERCGRSDFVCFRFARSFLRGGYGMFVESVRFAQRLSELEKRRERYRRRRRGQFDTRPRGHDLFLQSVDCMAADGQCKTFDTSADGYVRGEGCGVVVLKRQNDAEQHQDRIRALIRGSAVNQDGRSGVTDGSQRSGAGSGGPGSVERANVWSRPARSTHVEAHGTGTQLGDPIEANALANVYGKGRTAAKPLLIGSVKTNIGHLEAAAGLAGIIKIIFSLESHEIPLQRNLSHPESIDRLGECAAHSSDAGGEVGARSGEEAHGGSERFCVSRVECPRDRGGSSGAKEAQSKRSPRGARRSCQSSAPRVKGALRLNVEEWIKYLRRNRGDAADDIAYTAIQHRSQFEQRLAVVASDKKEAREKLAAYVRGEQGKRTSAPPSEAWLNANIAGETEKPQSDAEFVAAIEQLGWAHVEKVGDVRASALLSETGKRVTVPSYVSD